MSLTLHDFQDRDVVRLRAAFAAGHRAVLYVAPTGAGKTVTSAHIVRSAVDRGNRVLFAAGRTELIDQTLGKLTISGLTDVRVIQAERDEGNPDAPVIVGSIQTLAQRPQLPTVALGILDEAHHGPARTWAALVKSQPSAVWLGLSATPARQDGKPLGDLFSQLVVGPSVRELTDLGHLVPCRLWAGPPTLTSGQLALTPLEAYRQHGGDQLTAVFCRDVKHARAELDEFQGAGIPTEMVTGTLSATRRRSILAAWRAGDIRVVTSVGVLTEGFDLPQLSVAILARKFSHPGLYLQVIGRVLRPAPGKSQATVVDLCGSAHRPDFGPPDADRIYSLEGKAISTVARDAIRQCTSCGSVFLAGPAACPYCSEELPVRERELPRSVGAGVQELRAAQPRREYIASIVSKYPGRCVECGGAIQRGDSIWWATVAKKAKHRVCPRSVAA